ncbi:MAG: hypothetical protein J5885_01295 [Clostridia bacterium]|nr:hypothetical protein [Clostridia bacterium]
MPEFAFSGIAVNDFSTDFAGSESRREGLEKPLFHGDGSISPRERGAVKRNGKSLYPLDSR